MSTKKKPTPKTEAQNAEETVIDMLRRRNEELNAQIANQESHVDGWKQYAADLQSRNEVLLNGVTRIASIASGEMAGAQSRSEAIETLHRISKMPLRTKEQHFDLGTVEFCIKRPSANR